MQTKGFVVTIKKIILLWLLILLCFPWFLLHMHKHPPPTPPPPKILSSCVTSCSPCVMQKISSLGVWQNSASWLVKTHHVVLWLVSSPFIISLSSVSFFVPNCISSNQEYKKNAATAPMVPPMTATILLPGPKSKKWHEIMS